MAYDENMCGPIRTRKCRSTNWLINYILDFIVLNFYYQYPFFAYFSMLCLLMGFIKASPYIPSMISLVFRFHGIKNGQTYFKHLAVRITQDFKSIFVHFSTLWMKRLNAIYFPFFEEMWNKHYNIMIHKLWIELVKGYTSRPLFMIDQALICCEFWILRNF